MKTTTRCVLVLFGAAALWRPAHAQPCSPKWIPGDPIPGISGSQIGDVAAWDPDGDGPIPMRVAVCGIFSGAGRTEAIKVAVWNGTEWTSCSTGWSSPQSAQSLLALPSGDFVLGGSFSTIGNITAVNIARWDGAAWHSVGTPPGEVRALAATADGQLLAGGQGFIRRWTGTEWVHLDQADPQVDGTVSAIGVAPNGDIVIGGNLFGVGTASVRGVARWNGEAWSALGSGIQGIGTEPVRAIAALPDGSIAVGGRFSSAGGVAANNVARWDGENWSALAEGLTSASTPQVDTLLLLADGRLVAGGRFSSSGVTPVDNIAAWNGTAWQALGQGTNGEVFSLASPGGERLVAGGQFSQAGEVAALRVALWDGSAWSSFGQGTSSAPLAHANAPSGDLYAGGGFRAIGGSQIKGLARWNGIEWFEVGAGVEGGSIGALLQHSGGDLYAAGSFSSAGGVPANRIARWDGDAWHTLGDGLNANVRALSELPNGDVVASGDFTASGLLPLARIARWDGVAWTALADGFNNNVQATQVLPNGDLVAAGEFTASGANQLRRIARWDGASWSPLDRGFSATVYDLALLDDGRLVAAGNFFTGGTPPVAVWDGLAWRNLGTGAWGDVRALCVLRDGSVLASENSTYTYRWDGLAWSQIGISALTLHLSSEDEVVTGGLFGFTLGYAARWVQNPRPWAAIDPEPTAAQSFSVLQLTAAPATGYENVSYQWLRNGAEITNGEGGASAGGGTVSGASGTLESPTAGGRAVLTITGVRQSDAGDFSVVFSNDCGDDTSDGATVTVTCPADFDNSGQIDFFDYLDFAQAFANEDPRADFDNNGQVDFFDYLDFVTAFDAGC